jgi:hypothetical protein
MKQTLTKSQFRDAFKSMGRGKQFSYEGLGVLYDHLTEIEEDTGVEIELDVIALCCEYCESSAAEALSSYDLETLDDLIQNTEVLIIDDETIIYANY